jgi:hypothetical protein
MVLQRTLHTARSQTREVKNSIAYYTALGTSAALILGWGFINISALDTSVFVVAPPADSVGVVGQVDVPQQLQAAAASAVQGVQQLNAVSDQLQSILESAPTTTSGYYQY